MSYRGMSRLLGPEVRLDVECLPRRRDPAFKVAQATVAEALTEVNGEEQGAVELSVRGRQRVRILNDFGIRVARGRLPDFEAALRSEAPTLLDSFDVAWSGIGLYVTETRNSSGAGFFGVGSLLPDDEGGEDLATFRSDCLDVLAQYSEDTINIPRARQPDLALVVGFSDDRVALRDALDYVMGEVDVPLTLGMGGLMRVRMPGQEQPLTLTASKY